jgi:hypothetical protein
MYSVYDQSWYHTSVYHYVKEERQNIFESGLGRANGMRFYYSLFRDALNYL